jgi:hypothetical protein
VVFNSVTNSVTETDITPDILGTTYCPAGPEALETYAGDSRVILLLGVPVGGGDIHRLRSTDGGNSWLDLGLFEGDFVRWTGRNSAWLAGADGIGFTPDRGTELEDRSGNYITAIEAFPVIGVQGVN